MRDLAVLIPTRGRPGNVHKVVSAWDFTNAWDRADMVLVIDQDDPEIGGYRALESDLRHPDTGDPLIKLYEVPVWVPMVHKLNQAAAALAPGWFALGFAGDDHLPRTIGWADRYLAVLRELGSGMVYSDDGYQGKKLSTEWAITSDVVTALGRMVPADVEHMYCDNSIMEMFGTAGALRFLPELRVEHMHPYAGKAETDAQYQRVNHRDQFSRDRRAYESWRHGDVFQTDVAKIRHLRRGRPEVTEPTSTPNPAVRPRIAGSAPRRVERSGPTSRRLSQKPLAEKRIPRLPLGFKNVRAATPEDVMVALADFAVQVPADQEIVELGVFQGRTALQLAWGASLSNGAHVTAIDPWDLPGNVYDPPFTDAESRRWARHWVDSLGYADRITLVHDFSHNVAAAWIGPAVGLIYVDGDHTREGARRDIEMWAEHLAPGAVIAVDDYGHPDWPGVGQAVDELVAEGLLEPVEIYHDRMAVTRLSGKVEGGASENQDQRVTAITSEGVAIDHPGTALTVDTEPDEFDVALSAGPMPGPTLGNFHVQEGELDDVTAGTEIDQLNLVRLKALAKSRGIVLGARKDKRDLILDALRTGR